MINDNFWAATAVIVDFTYSILGKEYTDDQWNLWVYNSVFSVRTFIQYVEYIRKKNIISNS